MANRVEVPWPKLRRIFPPPLQRQYRPSKAIDELYSGPDEDTPNIPWNVEELSEKDKAPSKNSSPVENNNNGSIPPEKNSTAFTLQDKNSLPSTKIFEAVNNSFDNPTTTKEKLSPEMLFDTNPDSDKSKNPESTTVENKTSGKKLVKNAKKLGGFENVSDDSDDEIQILEIVDIDSSTNSKNNSITEPVNLDGDGDEEVDLVVEAGKRKQSLPFLNIVSENGIRIISGGSKNIASNSEDANKDKVEKRFDENLHKDNKDKSLRRKETNEATDESKIEKKRRKSRSSEDSAGERFFNNKEPDVIKIASKSNIPRNEPNNAAIEENDANLNRQPSPATISHLNESSRDKEQLQGTTADKTGGTPEENAKEKEKTIFSTTSGSESRAIDTTDKDATTLTLNNSFRTSSVDSVEEGGEEMLTVEKSFVDPTNPEPNSNETITFYESNDQEADNQLDETIIGNSKSQENSNDRGIINQVTEPARTNGQLYSILETTAVLRSLIEAEVKSLMKSTLVENILKKIVEEFLTNHLINNLISGLNKEQHQNVEQIQMEKQKSGNNATAANQANSPNLNPTEEINSENNLCPTQISPQDLSRSHMPQPQQPQRSVPLVLPPAPPPTHFQTSQTIPLCSCRNPTCVRNDNRSQSQMIAPNGNSSLLAHQYPTIYQQLNNYNGNPCPIVNNSHTVQMEQFVNNFCPTNSNTPPSSKSNPRPPKRKYNKKQADNSTIPAKVAKRGRKNSKNDRSPNQRRHSSSSEQGMTLEHTINSFHDVVGGYYSYNSQTANNSYSMHLNLQEQRRNLNYTHAGSLDPRHQVPQGLPPPSLHPPQMDSQYYNMQNQLRGQIRGGSSPAMDFDATRLRTPPATVSQNRIQSVSPQDNREPHYHQTSISSPVPGSTYEHYQQEADLVYPIQSANTLIFKSPAEHQKFLAQQTHNQSNVQIDGYFHQNYLVDKRI